MNRLTFLTLVILTGFFCACVSEREQVTPNVVYILADDLGYGDLSCLNENSKIDTPNLDRLAAEGMIFTDAHSGSAVCTPTRYGFITGRYAWRSRLKNGVLAGYSEHLIDPGRYTVADLFKAGGYHTAMIGKWHLGWDYVIETPPGQESFDIKEIEDGFDIAGISIDYSEPVKNGPDSLGFDYYYAHSGSLDMAPYVYVENGEITAEPNRETENVGKKFWRKGPTGADFEHIDVLPNFVRRTCDYISRRAKSGLPFFVYLALPAPHTPILPIESFQGKSGTNEYGDFVQQVDSHVGEIMDRLESEGVEEDTLIIFTSDNGCSPRADFEELGAIGHYPSYHFRGYKADIYEGGHRMPFIVRWPAQVEKGTVSDKTICLTDLMATAGDLLDVELPDDAAEDSVSMLPAMLGTDSAPPLREAIVHHSLHGAFAIRKGDWKLILAPGSGGWSDPTPEAAKKQGLPPIQLYNLQEDVGEQHNVYEGNSEVVTNLLSLLDRYVRQGRSTPGPAQSNEGETPYLPEGFETLQIDVQ